MVRPSDPFWEHVKKDSGSLECKYCPFVYSPGSSISRVKAHLSGLKGRGVSICTNPPPDVKEAARAEIEGTRERKKQKPGHTDGSDVTCLQPLGGGYSAAEPFEGNRTLEFVESKEDGASYCTFCGYNFGVDSIPRVKEHLSGIKGLGVSFCPSVPHDIMKAARSEIERTRERKRRKTDPDSIPDASDMTDLHRDNDDEYHVRDGLAVEPVSVSVSVQGMEQVPEEGDRSLVVVENIPQPPVRRDLFRSYFEEVDGKLRCKFCKGQFAAQTSTTRITMHFSGQAGRGVKSCTHVPDDVKKRAIEHVQKKGDRSRTAAENIPQPVATLVEQDVPFKMQMEDEDDTGRIGLLTEKFVGKAFDENLNKSLTSLRKDGVSCIGIFGMGGVGKTTLAMHIYNQLLENQDPPHRCYWFNVSLDFSIYKLQTLIARAIHLDLPSEDDLKIRAAKLHRVLTQMHNTVLVLDDLWTWFDGPLVGIPIGSNQCKLIITTRSLNICRRMCCQEIIRLSPLSEEEGWLLFKQKLRGVNTDVEELARSVTKECSGLPLALVTIAGSMRGVHDVCEWKYALEKLRESKIWQGDMNTDVLLVLQDSYLQLKDPILQGVFSFCALFPEDFSINRDKLIDHLIDEGMIEGRSRQAQFDMGHAMLNNLVSVCLLERVDEDTVRMHDLVRDMALDKLRENNIAMVEAGRHLDELPDTERWSESLVRVSLMDNDIGEIDFSHSPRCPNVSTLLLCRNQNLKVIADSFLMGFHGLKVLDLSDTAIHILPKSVSDLVSLRALSVRHCQKLKHVPSLAKLISLKKLDLNCTPLDQIPEGIEFLSKLKYLNLYGSCIKELPSMILSRLSHLQVLVLASWDDAGEIEDSDLPSPVSLASWDDAGEIEDSDLPSPVSRKVEEAMYLRNLEDLHCHFRNLQDFDMYIQSREGQQRLHSYTLLVGPMDEHTEDVRERSTLFHNEAPFVPSFKKIVCLSNCRISRKGGFLALPKDMQDLVIVECHDATSFCDISWLERATDLKSIFVGYCDGMECLLSMNLNVLKSIEYLYLYRLDNLLALISREGATPSPWPSNGTFSSLKKFEVWECHSLRKLLPAALVQNLKNLESVKVCDCSQMEEIIEEESYKNEDDLSVTIRTEFSLPKLWTLDLVDLPKLRSICRVKLRCSLESIYVKNCPKLKRMPPSFLLLLDKTPIPSLKLFISPKEWWDSVEWDPPNAKDVLQSLCQFGEE